MYGLIIVNQTVGHNEYKIKRFREEFPKLNINFDVFVNNGTLSSIENGNIKLNLPKADFVLYLDKDIYLARMLERSGYRLFNKPDFIKMCDDKMLTYIYCTNLGINMIKTFPSPLIYTEKLEESNYVFLDKVAQELSFPLVVKKVYGSLGEGIYLARNKEELRDIYSKTFRNPLLFQKYISTSAGKSLRALVVNHKLLGIIQRNNDGDFRSNYGDSNYSKIVENDKIYKDFANDIIKKLNIEYAGIDLLFDENNKPVLCEINSNAFFEEFEKTTGINVALKIGEMLIENLKQ